MDKQAVLERAKQLYNEGKKWREIAEMLAAEGTPIPEPSLRRASQQQGWANRVRQRHASEREKTMIQVSQIRRDGGTQSRGEMNTDVVAAYADEMRTGVEFPPIGVVFDGETYWLWDGFHRVQAAVNAGVDELSAYVEQGTQRDAVLLSVGANATHGLRRTNADKRRAVEMLLRDEEWGKWSDNQIARYCSVSQPFVSQIRSSLITVISDDRSYVNRFGSVTTMNTANIGARVSPAAHPENVTEDEIVLRYQPGYLAKCRHCDYIGGGWITPTGADYHMCPKCHTKCADDAMDLRDSVREVEQPRPVTRKPAVSEAPDYDGNEWYTPAEYIEVVRSFFGGEIDVDPASCDYAQRTVRANTYFTKRENGLVQDWTGRVWINPPYSYPEIEQFTKRLMNQYDEGITTEAVLLVNNSTDTDWFQALLCNYTVCFTDGRVKFEHPERDTFATRQGQAFFYLGSRVREFAEAFSRFGVVMVRFA
jgi:phage N-6-adenine-methyltransferase